jgi:hypothetical protein
MAIVIAALIVLAQAASGPSSASTPPGAQPIDVSRLKVGAPAVAAELDLGKVRGELRRLAWSDDGAEMFLQLVEQEKNPEVVHDFVVTLSDGAMRPVDREPEWAARYWAIKSDRYAPGIPSTEIAIEQHAPKGLRSTTGAAGSAAPTRFEPTNMAPDNVDHARHPNTEASVRFVLYEQIISEFYVNEQPAPGLMFGWGPKGSGAMAFVDGEGQLKLVDAQKHTQSVRGVKDAILPAWRADGSQIACLRKTGRGKYALVVVPVAR